MNLSEDEKLAENNATLGEDSTLDVEEFRRRQRERRRKIIESEDFTHSPEEIERRKREATETEIQ